MSIFNRPPTAYDESTNPSNGWAVPEQAPSMGCAEFDNAAPFADMGDDLDALAPSDRASLKAPKAAKPLFKVACLKCRGTGRYNAPSSHGSRCFACNGIGFRETKTDPTKLAANRAKAATKKAQAKSDAIGAWRVANPAEAKWIDANEGRFDFATAMSQALVDWGSLTPGQLGAIQRCIAKDVERSAARAVEQVKQVERAVEVNLDALEAAFRRASSSLKSPRITLNKTTFKPAKKHEGVLYVTRNGGDTYLGKIVGGKFMPSRDCSDEALREVVEMMADPKGAAEKFGRLTGHCCICSRLLVDPESTARGIGPICAERFGW